VNYRDYPDNDERVGRPSKYGFDRMEVGDVNVVDGPLERVRAAFYGWKSYRKFERGGIKMDFVQDGEKVIVRRVA